MNQLELILVVGLTILIEKSLSLASKKHHAIKPNFELSPPGCGLYGLGKISHGKNAREGQFPFAALLYRNSQPYGGSVIINERWLLSAAHNFKKKSSNYSVGVGSIKLKNLAIKKIQEIIVHERYQCKRKHDIAMIKLAEPLVFGETIRPICLPEYSSKGWKLNKVKALGWGYKQFKKRQVSEILQQIDLDLIPLNKCRKIYSQLNQDISCSHICTLSKNKDACTGDSGGPLFVYQNDRAILFGLISFGVSCADQYPGVHTAVFDYLEWIAQKIKNDQ